jgi:hypothetical protein
VPMRQPLSGIVTQAIAASPCKGPLTCSHSRKYLFLNPVA